MEVLDAGVQVKNNFNKKESFAGSFFVVYIIHHKISMVIDICQIFIFSVEYKSLYKKR